MASLRDVSDIKFSPDLSKALIVGSREKEIYCCDIASGTLCEISACTGEPVQAAWFLDDETVFCYGENAEGHVTGWKLRPFTDQSSLLFSGLPLYSRTSGIGLILSETGYGLYLDANQTAQVFDLRNGTRAIVEGLTCSGEDTFVSANAKGTKMLVSQFDPSAAG